MTDNRVFDDARREQGFRDQAHLDAFFRYMDHVRACVDCQHYSMAPVDDGMQVVREDCPVGKRLFRAQWS